MWWDILKNAKLSAKGKGKTLDTSRLKVNVQDNECNKQLQEWANKLKNYNLLLTKRYDDNNFLKTHFIISTADIDDTSKDFQITYKPISKKFASPLTGGSIFEYVSYLYNPVPENVACKAIDMLKKSTTGDYGSEDREKIGKYEIVVYNHRKLLRNNESNGNGLVISNEGLDAISLFWTNGGNVRARKDSVNEDLKYITPDLIYRVSGYYESKEFGLSWWK